MILELAAPTAENVYEAVSFLPTSERIKLAGLLITNVAPRDIVDASDHWSDEDYRDFSDASICVSSPPQSNGQSSDNSDTTDR